MKKKNKPIKKRSNYRIMKEDILPEDVSKEHVNVLDKPLQEQAMSYAEPAQSTKK